MINTNSLDDKILLEEVSRNFRTEIPNIIYELVTTGDLSIYEQYLYQTYRRMAGEHGECFAGQKKLSEITGISHTEIVRIKKKLSQPFKKLNDKPLIRIQKAPKQSNLADIVTIVDIWPENHAFFKNKLRCKAGLPPLSTTFTTPVNYVDTKNEPYKKKDIRSSITTIVHKSPIPKPPEISASPPLNGISPSAPVISAPSSAPPPPPPTAAQGSIPFSWEKEGQAAISPELIELLELEPQYIAYFRPKIVAYWIKYYGPAKVLAMMKYFYEVKERQKTPIYNAEAWMQDALKNDYNKNKQNILINKQYAERIKQTYKYRALKINKRYCVNTATRDNAYYDMDPETFRYLIHKMCGLDNT